MKPVWAFCNQFSKLGKFLEASLMDMERLLELPFRKAGYRMTSFEKRIYKLEKTTHTNCCNTSFFLQ